MNSRYRLIVLRRTYIKAEDRWLDAYRHLLLAERRVYDALTEDVFESRLASLKAQEKELHRLRTLAMAARADYYAAAEMPAR